MTGGGHGGPASQACLFLLFAPGARPTSLAVRAALEEAGRGHVSYDPADSEAIVVASDWLEVLVDGLTFDLLGLDPGQGLVVPTPRHGFGAAAGAFADCEAIGIAPGPHLAGAGAAMPVVRTLLGLAAALAPQWPGCRGALWRPSQTALPRDPFAQLVGEWLTGGAFPALALIGMVERPGGSFASDGLAFFTGQELVLDAALGLDRIAATRLVVRLVDAMVEGAALIGDHAVTLDGEEFYLTGAGPIVRVTPS